MPTQSAFQPWALYNVSATLHVSYYVSCILSRECVSGQDFVPVQVCVWNAGKDVGAGTEAWIAREHAIWAVAKHSVAEIHEACLSLRELRAAGVHEPVRHQWPLHDHGIC